MPTVLRIGSYRFFFYSNESNEPMHVHVGADDKAVKYWLKNVELAHSVGFKANELTEVRKLILQNREKLQEAWNVYFKRST